MQITIYKHISSTMFFYHLANVFTSIKYIRYQSWLSISENISSFLGGGPSWHKHIYTRISKQVHDVHGIGYWLALEEKKFWQLTTSPTCQQRVISNLVLKLQLKKFFRESRKWKCCAWKQITCKREFCMSFKMLKNK